MNFLIAFSLSLSTVPIPLLGLKIFFPLSILLALIYTKHFNLKQIIFVFLTLIYFLVFVLLNDSENHKNLVVFYILLSLSIWVLNFNISVKNWIKIAYIHILFFIISGISILILNYDLITKTIYGISKHSVGAFEYISFRASGLFEEPSTFSYHLLAFALIIHILDKENYLKEKFIILLFSLLSFSVASLTSVIAIIFIVLTSIKDIKTRIKIILILTPIISYFFYILYSFLIYKIEIYLSLGLIETARFKALYEYMELKHNFWGLSSESIKNNVVFDLGPIISSIIVFGIYSIPIVIILTLSLISYPILITLLITKIALTNPILWYLIYIIFTNNLRKKFND